eukprot:symbB.v1.2.036919.t1/scaffold5319.1/size29312/3
MLSALGRLCGQINISHLFVLQIHQGYATGINSMDGELVHFPASPSLFLWLWAGFFLCSAAIATILFLFVEAPVQALLGRSDNTARRRDYANGTTNGHVTNLSNPARFETEEPLREEATDGLFQRKAGRRAQVNSSTRSEPREREPRKEMGLLGETELLPPENLEELWQELLEDTLPPDKRDLLQASWQRTQSDSERYMLFLEYSSYLRKQEVTEEEKAERRKQLEPLLKEYGLDKPEPESQGCTWMMTLSLIALIAAIIYYTFRAVDPEATQIL